MTHSYTHRRIRAILSVAAVNEELAVKVRSIRATLDAALIVLVHPAILHVCHVLEAGLSSCKRCV